MPIQSINPFQPSELETKQFLGWEMAITDNELAMKTSTMRLYKIGAAVSSMAVEVAVEDATAQTGAIGAWTDGTTTTSLPVSSDLAGKITNYTVLKVENEIVVVKSVNRSSNTIDVFKRGHGATTGASHANGVIAEITGYNYVVGVKDIEARVNNQTTKEYYVAKVTVPSVKYTKEDLSIKRRLYGEQGQMDYVNNQIDRMDKDLMITLNKGLIYHGGEKATATSPGMFVGIIAEAMTRGNIVSNFGQLSDFTKFEDALTASRNKGGTANIVLCGGKAYDAINKWANASNITMTVPDRLQMTIGSSVQVLATKIGRLIPVMDLSFPDDKVVVLNDNNLFMAPLVGFELPGADRTVAQESTRNDQAFTVDSVAELCTYYYNTNRDVTILTGVTYA